MSRRPLAAVIAASAALAAGIADGHGSVERPADPPTHGAERSPSVTRLHVAVEGAGTLAFDSTPHAHADPVCDYRIGMFARFDCEARYSVGTRVTVTAIADPSVPGSRLVAWSDYRCPQGGSSCTLTLQGEHSLTAFFDPVFLRLVRGNFAIIRRTPGSAPCTVERNAGQRGALMCPYRRNSRVTLTRDPEVDIGASTAKPSFWHGACRGYAKTCRLQMYEDRRVFAGTDVIVPLGKIGEAIRLEYAGPRGGTIEIRGITSRDRFPRCRRTCVARFVRGELVEVEARSGRGARFRRWADSRTRSKVRRLRVGTHNPVRAIFARRR